MQTCHAMASPSLSSSVARYTSSDSFMARSNLLICDALDVISWKCGVKLSFTSTHLRSDSCLKCPKVAIHLKPAPKNPSIFPHFAGDSTMTRLCDDLSLLAFLFNI